MESPRTDSTHVPEPAGEFRTTATRSRVEEFYAFDHARQTLAFVLAKKQGSRSESKDVTAWGGARVSQHPRR